MRTKPSLIRNSTGAATAVTHECRVNGTKQPHRSHRLKTPERTKSVDFTRSGSYPAEETWQCQADAKCVRRSRVVAKIFNSWRADWLINEDVATTSRRQVIADHASNDHSKKWIARLPGRIARRFC